MKEAYCYVTHTIKFVDIQANEGDLLLWYKRIHSESWNFGAVGLDCKHFSNKKKRVGLHLW